MAANKGKDTKNECHGSLIPILEREEQQLRTELEQVRLEAKDQIRQAEKQAEQHIQQSRLNISKLVEQKRREGLAELEKHAEQLSRSSEEYSAHLQLQAKNNMARAVQNVVNAVTGAGDRT